MRILKWLGIGIIGLVAIIVTTIVIIWFFPYIIVNEKNVRWAASKQSYVKFEPAFPEKFEVDLHNSHVFKQHFKISVSDFCIRLSDQSFHGCFQAFNFKTVFDFHKFKLGFDSIGPLNIQSTLLTIDTTKFSKSEPTKKKKKRSTLPVISDEFIIDEINVDLSKIEVKSEKSKMDISLSIQGKKTDTHQPYHFSAETKVDLDKDPRTIMAKLNTELESNLDVKGSLNAHVGSSGKKPAIDLDAKLTGNIFRQQGELEGKILAMRLAPMIPKLEVNHFKISKTDKLIVDADFNSELMIGYLNNPRKSALPAPEFQTKFSGNLKGEQSANQPITFDLKINPLEQYGMSLFAKIKGDYDTKNSNLGLETAFISFKIDDFQKTVKGLHHTQLAIPAPLNEMHGTVKFQIGKEEMVKSIEQNYSIPLTLTTNLESPRQALKIETNGSIDFSMKPKFSGKAKVNIALNEISLQLPNFDPVSKLPNVVGDKRFVKTEKDVKEKEMFKEEEVKQKKQAPSSFSTEIHVTTPQKPIRIYYKLFKPAAIFRVSSNVLNEKSDFQVKSEPFDIEYMKRTARLERLDISNDDEAESILLDGRFSMKKADYKIFVNMHQENKKTYVELTSEPPLSEDDIVSLILFNELSSSLDSTATGSVASTQDAMAKRTIGFFSFFLLASTPVESVNYDPSTQQFSARVKLPGGFTGTVGSDFDQAQEVGLRRRLGGKFVITTDYGTDQFGQQRQESMVEWYHRY